MEKTFDDKLPHPDQDQQRRLDNAVRSEKGEPQIGGSAGRQQVADKTTSGGYHHDIEVIHKL